MGAMLVTVCTDNITLLDLFHGLVNAILFEYSIDVV